MAGRNGQMRHLHLSVIDDCHLLHPAMIPRKLPLDLLQESPVDLLHNLVNTGQQPGEDLNGPFLQRFRHNGMVRVSAYLGGNLPCSIPLHAFHIQKDTHQLGHSHSGMGIVQLECHLLRHPA